MCKRPVGRPTLTTVQRVIVLTPGQISPVWPPKKPTTWTVIELRKSGKLVGTYFCDSRADAKVRRDEIVRSLTKKESNNV